MTEISDISDYSSPSIKLDSNINLNEDNNQIRCPICSNLSNLIEADFKNNFFSINCDNIHKENKVDYNSFSSFTENTLKNLEDVLCNNCKKSKNEKEIFRCDDCFLFLCEDCKYEHENKFSHLNFIYINDVDKNKNENLLLNQNIPEENEINKEYNNIKENINICKNISAIFYQWIDEMINKFKSYFLQLNNYFYLEKIIVSNIKNYYNSSKIIFNNKIFENYDFLFPNKYFINNYVQSINNKINSTNKSFKEKSLIFLKIIQNLDEIDAYFNLNRKSLDIPKSKSENFEKRNKNNIDIEEKISDMLIEKLDINQIQSFNSFRNDKYLLLGTKNGELAIYEIPDRKEEKSNQKIIIKIFEENIKNICVMNKDIIIISNGKNLIKIIRFDEDIVNYEIIQIISLNKNEIDLLYKIIPLNIFFQNNNGNYFCTADDNNIIIYKENNTTGKQLFFEYKIIQLNTLIQNLLEVNNKYLIASCPKKNKIIFFDIKNNFKSSKEIEGINISFGSNNLALINENKILVIGTMNGFELISIKNLIKIKSIHCKYSVISLEKINENTIICCNKDKYKENKMRQFKINNTNYDFKKISERNINNNEIWKLKYFNGKIYFLDINDDLYYLK